MALTGDARALEGAPTKTRGAKREVAVQPPKQEGRSKVPGQLLGALALIIVGAGGMKFWESRTNAEHAATGAPATAEPINRQGLGTETATSGAVVYVEGHAFTRALLAQLRNNPNVDYIPRDALAASDIGGGEYIILRMDGHTFNVVDNTSAAGGRGPMELDFNKMH